LAGGPHGDLPERFNRSPAGTSLLDSSQLWDSATASTVPWTIRPSVPNKFSISAQEEDFLFFPFLLYLSLILVFKNRKTMDFYIYLDMAKNLVIQMWGNLNFIQSNPKAKTIGK